MNVQQQDDALREFQGNYLQPFLVYNNYYLQEVSAKQLSTSNSARHLEEDNNFCVDLDISTANFLKKP